MVNTVRSNFVAIAVWSIRLAVLIAVLSAACFGVLVWRAKPVAAAICPQCFGFESSGKQVYVERSMPAGESLKVQRALTLAEERIRGFYGDNGIYPRVLVCATQKCIRRIGGGNASSGSVGSFVMILGPQGASVTEMTHELSLIEVSKRIGVFHTIMESVPAWFDEGVAVLAANDPAYIGPANTKRDRCLARPEEDLPVDMQSWVNESNQYPFINAQAACRVYEWMRARGGSNSIVILLGQIAHGQTFMSAYGGQ